MLKITKLLTVAALVAAFASPAVADNSLLGTVSDGGKTITTPACKINMDGCHRMLLLSPQSLTSYFGDSIAQRLISANGIVGINPDFEIDFGDHKIIRLVHRL